MTGIFAIIELFLMPKEGVILNCWNIIVIIITVLVVIAIFDKIIKFYKNLLIVNKLPDKIQGLDVSISRAMDDFEAENNEFVKRLQSVEQNLLQKHEELLKREDQFIQTTQDIYQSIDNLFSSLTLLSQVVEKPDTPGAADKIKGIQEMLRFNIRSADQHLTELRQLRLEDTCDLESPELE